MPIRLLALALLLAAPAAAQPPPSAQEAVEQLAAAERAWLDAYDDDDREAMAEALADGFTIVFPDGTVQTRAEVIAGLDPGSPPDDGPTHYTEDRAIRVIGTTAILSGVYVSPSDARPDVRMRYTDTWMWLGGRWRVVASHLSRSRPAAE